jgi:hypothetical protein
MRSIETFSLKIYGKILAKLRGFGQERRKVRKSKNIVVWTPDVALAHHLKKAEEHLIEAVKLFGKKHPPDRHHDFVERLGRVQERVTTLHREELIRIRGPIKVAATSSKRKK